MCKVGLDSLTLGDKTSKFGYSIHDRKYVTQWLFFVGIRLGWTPTNWVHLSSRLGWELETLCNQGK